jgi:hypothetical protein
MITHYLCRQLALDNPVEMLKLFTMNTENPYLIWNNGTRAELNEFLEKQQTKALRGGDQDPTFGAGFQFSDLSKEVCRILFLLSSLVPSEPFFFFFFFFLAYCWSPLYSDLQSATQLSS